MTALAHSTANPRALLRQMRTLMAEPGEGTIKLDQTVKMIAETMVAEVCSVYIMRADDMLELRATEGLNPDAIRKTLLRVGQGLVGVIAATARPLNLAEAQQHPNFAYRPETGEEKFHAFLGVPILRGGRVLGVLAVQNINPRHYDDDEVEALQTVAMVLAELVGSGDFGTVRNLQDDALQHNLTRRLEVMGLADGIAMGTAVFHEARVVVEKILADDTDEEHLRLTRAIAQLREGIDRLLDQSDVSLAGEHRDVLEAYRMFAHDRGWIRRMREAVNRGLTAEAAAEKVQVENRARMQHQTDPYLRERMHDLDDLSNRLLRYLVGDDPNQVKENLPDDAIIMARSMGPAELLDYDRSKLRGIVLAEGSPTSHVAIVARALDLPLVGKAEDVLDSTSTGDTIIVDADTGVAFIRPSEDIKSGYAETIATRTKRIEEYVAVKDEPAITKDGTRIFLNMNAGLMVDLQTFQDVGADGIGLFRTELQFMVSSQLPRIEPQVELYSKVIDAAGDRPVIFRTIDVGGDKVLPYLGTTREENPALGWRAIRITLDRPALLRHQVRALLKAAAGRPLSIMFPMVADVSEFQAARSIVEKELKRLDKLGEPHPTDLKIGTMLEVPSLAWQLNALLPLVDFVSVGSNDLMQFFFASDRGNPRLANRYDLLSPSVLAFLNFLVSACNAHDVPISLCGEMAGKPLEAMALIGIGFRTISMPPAAIGPVKMMVRSLDLPVLEDFMMSLFDMPDHSVRGNLETFARDHKIDF